MNELRTSGDEPQLTRVLAAVLASDADATRSFLKLLLDNAAEDPAIGHRARSLRLPRKVACSPEHGLIRRGRGRARRQAEALGRADLLFTADRFRLICELKIDSRYQKDQIARYLDSGDHVISIVRKPTAAGLGKRIARHDRWLGEVAWASIKSGLRQLPLKGKLRQQWLDLLAVMEEDGDFEETKRRSAGKKDTKLAEEATKAAVRRFGRSRRLDAAHRRFFKGLEIKPGVGFRFGFAEVFDEDGTPYWAVLARDARTRTPELMIEWYPWPRAPVGSGQREMHERLEVDYHFDRGTRGGVPYYTKRQTLTADPGSDPVDEAAAWVYSQMAAVADVGLLDYDADL